LGNLILFALRQKVTKKSRDLTRPSETLSQSRGISKKEYLSYLTRKTGVRWRKSSKLAPLSLRQKGFLTPSSLVFRLTRRGQSSHITDLGIKTSYFINEMMHKRKFPNLGKAWEFLKRILNEFFV